MGRDGPRNRGWGIRGLLTALAITASSACGELDPVKPTAPGDRVSSAAPAPTNAGGSATSVITEIVVVDLGTLPGGTNSTATDISDAGDIVGTSETSTGDDHGFFLSGTTMTDVGTLPGGSWSRANGLNELGQVVGSAHVTGDVFHAFLWESATEIIRDLGAFPPQDDIGSSSAAAAINDAGLIAGRVDLAGVVWDLVGTPNYPPFPPYVRVTDPDPFRPSAATDINQAGQVVGELLSLAVGFRWESGVLEPLAALEAADDRAEGINELGQAVGIAALAPPLRYHAVLWPDPATVLDLGTLGGDDSAAFDINDDGFVVGESETATGETVAFVWHADLGMQPLGGLGGANSRAHAINAAGLIVGESETAAGEVHATLWTFSVAARVRVDIKPGSEPNSVNPRSHGVIPVAVLSDDDFDATTVDPLSVVFGPGRAREAHGKGHVEDADGDGVADLVLHFRTQATALVCGDTEAVLEGETFDGDAVSGVDSIRTVGCG